MVPILLLACALPSALSDESCAMQLAVSQRSNDCTVWCKAEFQKRFETRWKKDYLCTGDPNKKGSGRCLPAWFKDDAAATRFFANNGPKLPPLHELSDYDTLYSFGSGADGSGFRRAQMQAEIATKEGLKPYIDALVLPDQDGAYRLKKAADEMTRSRNVHWKNYYKFMIKTTNYMVMLIDKFWLASPNCHEEFLWVKQHFKTATSKKLIVAFVGNDMQGKSIWQRSQAEGDVSLWRWVQGTMSNLKLKAALKAGMAPTPRDVWNLFRCQFEPAGKRTARDTVDLYFKNPTIGPNGDIPNMVTKTSVAAGGRRGSFLKEIADHRKSAQGKKQEVKRRAVFVAAAAGAAGLQFAWNAVEEWWNRPEEPQWYDEPNNGSVALVSLVSSAESKPAATRPAARKPAAPAAKGAEAGRKKQCAAAAKQMGRTRPQKPSPGASKGKAVKPTPPKRQLLPSKKQVTGAAKGVAKGAAKSAAINVAQKLWAMHFIANMSFDVCEKGPRVMGKGETCSQFGSGKVFNYPCGFLGRYCAKDQLGCSAKHGMNMVAMAGAVPAFGKAFKTGRIAAKAGISLKQLPSGSDTLSMNSHQTVTASHIVSYCDIL